MWRAMSVLLVPLVLSPSDTAFPHKLCHFIVEWVGLLDALAMAAVTLAMSHLMQKSRLHLSCYKLY